MNKSKCEICGIGVKKSEVVALCGLKNVLLVSDTIRVLGVHFSYNSDLYIQRNFIDVIKKIENVINIWNIRGLSLLGKITVFKSLAISKIVYISYISAIPPEVISSLEHIHKKIIWGNKRAKI